MNVEIKECFRELVGVTRTECDCIEVDSLVKKSKLSLYIDEHKSLSLKLIQDVLGCGEEIESEFKKTYSNAVNFFESDFQVAISENHKQKYKPYRGSIGKLNYSTPSNNKSAFKGISIKGKPLEGASIVIDSITLFFNKEATIELKVYKNNIEIESYPITVRLGATVYQLDKPLNLPLFDSEMQNTYVIGYSHLHEDLKPLENLVTCGTCGNIDHVRKNFVDVSGVYGNDVYSTSNSTDAFGISINTVISCSILDMICPAMQDELFQRRAGMALWYKIGEMMLGKALASSNINFNIMSNREQMAKDEAILKNSYKSLVSWLAENSDIKNSECFICDPEKTMTVGKILI
ncbi:hypothetical protein HX049_02585 [Myroides odoratimimus]|uniref:hypothetical protein n=1 Tax=Myroides odoratimimus TaxID=76832 RepID=UPI002575142F|nr:hypothetical protein [Myroides odoratimimus]MDM1396067.1 hypothetical protein [Myroides odoratimimus]